MHPVDDVHADSIQAVAAIRLDFSFLRSQVRQWEPAPMPEGWQIPKRRPASRCKQTGRRL